MRDVKTAKSELVELKDKIFFRDSRPVRDIPVDELYSHYAEIFGDKSPRKIYSTMAKHCDDLKIRLSPGSVTFLHQDGNSKAATEVCKNFTKASSISLETMDVFYNKGNGTAKKVLANLVNLIETDFPNIRRVTVNSCDVGSYAWARFGFAPNAKNWQMMKERNDDDVPYRLLERKHLIMDQLSPEESAALDTIIACKDPKSIWMLADMAKEIISPLSEEKTSLGKYFLEDNWWDGSLNLKNPEAMSRFKGYVAKLGIDREMDDKEAGKRITR